MCVYVHSLQASGFTQARFRVPPESGFRVPGFRVAYPEGEGVGGVAEQAGRGDCQNLVLGLGFRVQGFKVYGFGFRISDFGLTV